jgi:acetylornithine deacetylase/succinyl-diaminopimelate desuccinylase family protein
MTQPLPEVTRILAELIAAPSPNPPGDCEAVSLVCRRWLDELAIPYRVVRSPDGTPSVIVTLGQGDRRFLIHSHYDTQPPGDLSAWASPPYEPTVRDGSIYGRGAGDDKGSVAAQLAALLALRRDGFDPPYELRFAFVADEESGGDRGTRFLVKSRELDCDAALVGEQTDNQLAIGERGIVWMRVTFTGRAAHGAIPSAGISAIVPAARFVARLEDELVPRLAERRPTPLLPASSLTIGQLHGGIDVSIVPERAVVELDRRIAPGETVAGCFDEIRVLAEDVRAVHPGVGVELETFLAAPAFLTPEAHPFVAACRTAMIDAGLPDAITGYRQASDARFLAARGIPIVIFGPSDPAVGHAANEHVRIADLELAAQAIERIARSPFSL